jgi:hypothetical protein
MKRNIFMAVLGMGSMGLAYGQGQVDFSNYYSPASPKVTFNANPALVPAGAAGLSVGNGVTAELAYYVGTSASDKPTSLSQMTLMPASIVPFGLAGGDANGSTYAGWFEAGLVTIPGISPANNTFVSFDVLAFVGADWASALYAGSSGIFQSPVTGTSQDNPGGFTQGPWQNFTVQATAVPEPTTLALVGLGSLASLVAMRRKQS